MHIQNILTNCSFFLKLASLKDDMVDRIFFSLTPSLVNPADYPPRSITSGMAPDYNQPYESSKFMEARKYLLPGIKRMANSLFDICEDEVQHYYPNAKEDSPEIRKKSLNELNFFIKKNNDKIESLKKIKELFEKDWGEYPAFGGQSWANIANIALNLLISLKNAEFAIKKHEDYKKIQKVPNYGSKEYKEYEKEKLELEKIERESLNLVISYANAADGLVHNTGSILEKILQNDIIEESELKEKDIKNIFKENYIEIADKLKSVDGSIEFTGLSSPEDIEKKFKIIKLSPLKKFLTLSGRGYSDLYIVLIIIKNLIEGNEGVVEKMIRSLIKNFEEGKINNKKEIARREIIEKANLAGVDFVEDDLDHSLSLERVVSDKVKDTSYRLRELEKLMDVKEIQDQTMVRDLILPYITDPNGSIGQRYKASPFRDFLDVAKRSRYQNDSNIIESELKLIRFRKENLKKYKSIDDNLASIKKFISSTDMDGNSLMNYEFNSDPNSFFAKKIKDIKNNIIKEYRNNYLNYYREVWALLDDTENFFKENIKEDKKQEVLQNLENIRNSLKYSHLGDEIDSINFQYLVQSFFIKEFETKEDIQIELEKVILRFKKIIKTMGEVKIFCELNSIPKDYIKISESNQFASFASNNIFKRAQVFKKLLTKST